MDKDGHISLPGFHDSVRQLTETEAQLYDAIVNKDIEEMGLTEDVELQRKKQRDILMSRWRLPSLSIHQVTSTGDSAGKSSVIPKAVKADISLRLVPDQNIDDVVKSLNDYLSSEFSDLHSQNHFTCEISHKADWWLGDPLNKGFQLLERAVKEEWDQSPLFIREGGSIPAVRRLEKLTGAPAIHFPLGQASDQAHLINERIRLVNLLKGRNVLKRLFKELDALEK